MILTSKFDSSMMNINPVSINNSANIQIHYVHNDNT